MSLSSLRNLNVQTTRAAGRKWLQEFTAIDLFYAAGLLLTLFSVVVGIVYGASDSTFYKRGEMAQAVAAGASGDVIRQITYFAIFFVVLGVTTVRTRGFPGMPISLFYNMACLWCLVSFTWAIVPGISFRRAMGMYIVLLSVAWCVRDLGARRTIRVLYFFLATLVTISVCAALLSSIPLFSFAVHPSNEADASLIGAWKGVMMHKNVAGAVTLHSSLFFFHHCINKGRKQDWFFLFLSVLFLIETKSKTSLGWFLLVLCIGLVYRYLIMRRLEIIFKILTAAVVGCIVTFAYIMRDAVYEFFTTVGNLSGRTDIWMSLTPYIKEHPILGSGYGSFWAIGDNSPIYDSALTDFVASIGHSHSGYIEVLLTTGLIGLTLAMIALVIMPYIRFANSLPGDALLNPMLLSMWLFGLVQNMTETQFFAADKQSWIFVVITITVAHSRYAASQKGRFQYLEETSWMPWRGYAKKD